MVVAVRVSMVVVVAMTMVVIGANTLHMVVMAFLRLANFVLYTNDLYSVLAQLTVHIGVATGNLVEALNKGVDHFFVGVKVRGFNHLNVWMGGDVFIGSRINTFH